MHCFSQLKPLVKTPLPWILILALAIRCYSALARGIVNPDAAHYIYQAKAIFYLDWSSITSCNVEYLSLLPIFIAAAFTLIRDWIAAGVVVNIVFGTAVLIPVYHIVKRFLDHPATYLTVLIYAVMPAYVSGSGDILKGPIAWFFMTMGILMFIRHYDETRHRYRYDLILSCIFFLLAAWARIEAVVLIAGTVLFLLISDFRRSAVRIVFFLAPIISIGLVGFAAALVLDLPIGSLFRLDVILTKLPQFIGNYERLHQELNSALPQLNTLDYDFFKHIRDILWMIPIGIILNNIIGGFFYLYTLIYFWGYAGIGKAIRQDRRIGYFLCLTVVALITLYIHLIQNWLIYHRFLAIIYFPGAIFFGFGLQKMIGFFQTRFKQQAKTAIITVATIIAILGIAKNLRPKEEDKVIYRYAAKIIARQKGVNDIAPIAAMPTRAYHWVFFYAHRNYPGPICIRTLRGQIPGTYPLFVSGLQEKNIRYVLYEEQSWPKDKFDLLAGPYTKDFKPLGQWTDDRGKKLILFERL